MATAFPKLRAEVRRIMLRTGVTLPFTDVALFQVISEDLRFHGAKLEDVRDALVWNQTEQFLIKERDVENECDTYRLTQKGIVNTAL